MVISALENDDYEQIKEYLKPLVLYWYEHFKNNTADFKLTKGEAIDASFKYLKTGLEKYHERLETEKTGFKFSSYFEWFIRQALIERAKENNK